MPPPGGCGCGSAQPPRGTASTRQRGNGGEGERGISYRRSDLCLRGCRVAASASDLKEGGGPKWRPEETFDPQVTVEDITLGTRCLAQEATAGAFRTYSQAEAFYARGLNFLGKSFWAATTSLPGAS